jgi:DNA polymerase-3 subunit delta
MGFSEDRARGKYGPRYVLVAENGYLLWDAIEDWKRVWRQSEHIPLDTFRAPKIDYDRLLDVGATIPMFGEVRLVVIQDAERVADKQQKRLLDALARFGDSTKVLVAAHKLDKRKKTYKGLKAWGDLEEFPRIYDNQIPGWAKRIAGDFGWQLAPDAAGLLATTFGDDLFSVRQTIERATLYIGNRRRIESADVEIVLAGEGTHTVFLLLNALGDGDLNRSLAIVRSLFAGQDQPHLWLAALSSLLQRLLRLAELDEPDKFTAARQTGIHHRFIDQARSQVRHFRTQGLSAAILACFETEWAIKTSRVTPRLGWELLVYRLCSRKALNGPPFFDLENPELGE